MPKSKTKQNRTTAKKAEREKNKECEAATLKALLVIGFGRSIGIPLPQTSDFIKGRNSGQRTGKKSHLHFSLSYHFQMGRLLFLTPPHPVPPHPVALISGVASVRVPPGQSVETEGPGVRLLPWAEGEGRRSDYREVLLPDSLPPLPSPSPSSPPPRVLQSLTAWPGSSPLTSAHVSLVSALGGRDVALQYSSYRAEVRFQIHDIEIGVKGPVAPSPPLLFSFIPRRPLELDHKGGVVVEVYHHEMRPSLIAFHHCDWWPWP